MENNSLSACVFCGKEGKKIYDGLCDHFYGVEGNFSFYRCSSCGLLWLSPRLKETNIISSHDGLFLHDGAQQQPSLSDKRLWGALRDWMRQSIICGYYGYQGYHKQHNFCRLGSVLGRFSLLRSRAIYGLGELMPYADKKDESFIVDIGCGEGGYLGFLKQAGRQRLLGIEPNLKACDIARKKGLKIFNGTLAEAGVEDNSVDWLTMVHVLEHLSEPLAMLKDCYRVLRPGARLVMRTPNVESLGHRVFKNFWMPLDPPRHIYLYSPKAMSLFLKQIPFKAVSIKTVTQHAMTTFDVSRIIFKTGRADREKISVQKGRALFAFSEWLLTKFGGNFGEEVEVVAYK